MKQTKITEEEYDFKSLFNEYLFKSLEAERIFGRGD